MTPVRLPSWVPRIVLPTLLLISLVITAARWQPYVLVGTLSYTCLDFTWDGARCVNGDRPDGAVVYDTATCDELFSLDCPEGVAGGAAFSPDASYIVSHNAIYWGGDDGAPRRLVAHLWDAETGALLRTFDIGQTMTECCVWPKVATSEDGSTVYAWVRFSPVGESAEGGEIIKAWDAQTGDEVAAVPRNSVERNWAHSDGRRMARVEDNDTVVLSDRRTGEELARFGIARYPDTGLVALLLGRYQEIFVDPYWARFAPDGRTVVVTDDLWHLLYRRRRPEGWRGHSRRPEIWVAVVVGLSWLVLQLRRRGCAGSVDTDETARV